MRIRWDRIFLLVSLWLGVGFMLSFEVYFNLRVIEPDAVVMVDEIVYFQFQRATLWMLMVPLVVWLRQRVPLDRGHWFGGIGLHLAVSCAIMAGYYFARILYMMESKDLPMAQFWEVSHKNFWGRNIIDMVFYWVTIAGCYMTDFYRRVRAEEVKIAQLESRLLEAELSVLKQQLHPHFLFNALNTVASLVREQKNPEAVQLLSKISSLLRLTLESARIQQVTLRQEVDFIVRYLEIQQARFADRLGFSIDIEPSAMEAKVPNLLLQPLVENAVLHGLASKPERGTVVVRAGVRDRRLWMEVRDDGVGFDVRRPISRSGGGIGLQNTRERLERLHGPSHRFVIESAPGSGTSIKLELPYSTS